MSDQAMQSVNTRMWREESFVTEFDCTKMQRGNKSNGRIRLALASTIPQVDYRQSSAVERMADQSKHRISPKDLMEM